MMLNMYEHISTVSHSQQSVTVSPQCRGRATKNIQYRRRAYDVSLSISQSHFNACTVTERYEQSFHVLNPNPNSLACNVMSKVFMCLTLRPFLITIFEQQQQ